MPPTTDYVVVGAGSAGCVLAARLSQDPTVKVTLLEAGGSDRNFTIQMPSALSIPMNSKRFNWGFKTEAEPFLDGRVIDCPRGLTLGGSSSINGMVYVRGHPLDFDHWEEEGADGWNYQSCLPYFKKAETWIDGANDYRGGDGPLMVCKGNDMQLNPLYEAFIRAGQQAGYPVTDDYNGYQQEGFGQMHMTIESGVRASTAHAYLRPNMSRKNLTVIMKSLAVRVLFEGKRAIGVEYICDGKTKKMLANCEVILAAGSIGSPALLQRSGVGPKELLSHHGIECVHDLPGVGKNLQDHLEIYFQHECRKAISLNGKLDVLSKLAISLRWFLFKGGLGSTNHFESCGFIRSRAGVKWPDIQYHFLPGAMRYDGQAAFRGHGFQVHVGPNRPLSRGRVAITSKEPGAHPSIQFNYLENDQDRYDFRTCIHLTREIIAQPSMLEYRGDEIQPGADIVTDSEIDQWVRENCESAYHPSCTCRMGSPNDPLAVTDSHCFVQHLGSLRVVDSSVFPTIPNGNLNAATIMVAERVSDMILGNELLSPSEAPIWIDEHWRTRQRSSAK
ncbi:MAG: choline dehydrogenase [Acidiferrobacteraceae bacterium]|nr:choline dehydrogenase [Acidiferrobacteraceae bacterium]